MINLKTPQEIQIMLEGGKIARSAIDTAVKVAKAGMTTMDLNNLAERIILDSGGIPCFKGYDGFPFATCINVNAGIVHGIPNNYLIKKGDVVSVDLGVLYKGLNTDVSETFEVETHAQDKFLEIGRKALENAIFACQLDARIGDISSAIQKTVENAGYSVSRDLAGHGLGKDIHEDPFVTCFGRPGKGEKLVEGLVLALEIIYQKGKPDLVLSRDGWTLSTKDGSLSGLYEKSVAVTKQGPLVLT
jgi:methionyl aminopeptidase